VGNESDRDDNMHSHNRWNLATLERHLKAIWYREKEVMDHLLDVL
jgi:hypothetical protein